MSGFGPIWCAQEARFDLRHRVRRWALLRTTVRPDRRVRSPLPHPAPLEIAQHLARGVVARPDDDDVIARLGAHEYVRCTLVPGPAVPGPAPAGARRAAIIGSPAARVKPVTGWASSASMAIRGGTGRGAGTRGARARMPPKTTTVPDCIRFSADFRVYYQDHSESVEPISEGLEKKLVVRCTKKMSQFAQTAAI